MPSTRPFGAGLSRLCAVIAAPTAAEMMAQVRLALREASTIELRLDYLANDAERSRFLDSLRRHRPRAQFIATCRRRAAGGLFPDTAASELDWLERARAVGCLWCDFEIETYRELPGDFRRHRALPRILLSAHDFRRTPPLDRLCRTLLHAQPDAIKIAAVARTISESVRLLHLPSGSRKCVSVAMGEVGLPARVLALAHGSALAYAPIAAATAPGQVSLQEMKHLYRVHRLTPQTQVYGVIGAPISHSLSPLLHNTGFIARHLNSVFLPFLVENLGEFLKAVPDFGIRGISVTLPHKQAILRHLKDCDPLAARIGAVNTVVVRRDGSLLGTNTDYLGVLRALEKKLALARSRIVILGAGGAARAAAFALVRAGSQVSICARRESAARQLARLAGAEVLPRRALKSESFDALINATPVGMHPHTGISPLAPSELHCRILMDLIYRPQQTQLLKLAARKGIATVSGVEMFLAQGMAQFEIWTRRPAPQSAMRRIVLAALRNEERRRSRS
jgi:3-dehydroquinate dehydratase / shikimate dehydrogenase